MRYPVADVHGNNVALIRFLAEQNRRPLRYIKMTGAMETVAAHAMLGIPFVGHRIGIGMFRHGLMESGIKNGNVWNLGENRLSRFNAGNIGRVVQWGKVLNLLDGIKDMIVNTDRTSEFFTAMNDPMANCGYLIHIGDDAVFLAA